MDSYQDYNHGANGLVILNEDGFDRLILGEEGPIRMWANVSRPSRGC